MVKLGMKKNSALVIFGSKFPQKQNAWWRQFTVVFAHTIIRERIEAKGCTWVNIENYIEPGSIYEASAFAEKLSQLILPNGTPVTKSCIYKGYELWWIHYSDLYLHFCLPYTQYEKLLTYLTKFNEVYLYELPYSELWKMYGEAHGIKVHVRHLRTHSSFRYFSPGVFLQVLVTLLSVVVLLVHRNTTLVFTGDKFAQGKDYDARMQGIYEGLRTRNTRFTEFVRSLESWKIVFAHAIQRKRPVVYSIALAACGAGLSFVTGFHYRMGKRYTPRQFDSIEDNSQRFKLMVATHYLRFVGDDIWGIRLNRMLLRILGIKVASVTSANDRNFQTVLGCKLNHIPTIGILHGFASHMYNVCDFMHTYSGTKILSVDRYGLWSEWWKSYYIQHSRAYRPEQLYVSGSMRPVPVAALPMKQGRDYTSPIQVLFVSEIVAVPDEVIPYLEKLLSTEDVSVHIKFRAHQDSFEYWLKTHKPYILSQVGESRIHKGSMSEAIGAIDVVVGSQSTGVIESVLQQKPFVFFYTEKWGDYFSIRSLEEKDQLFAENPSMLIQCVRQSGKIPAETLEKIREKFFGDPTQNGSKWVVDQLMAQIRS